MRAGIAALLVSAALTGSLAHAQTVDAESQAPMARVTPAPAAEPAAQPIDADRSQSLFSVRLRWMQRLDARFTRFDGELLRLPDGHRRVQVRLQADSVEFPGHPRYTAWAKSDSFFDAERFREISFRSAPFAPAVLREGGRISGDLRLRGLERSTRFYIAPASCTRPGLDCPIEVRGTTRRSRFGMTAWSVAVQDRVRFAFRIWLRDEPPA